MIYFKKGIRALTRFSYGLGSSKRSTRALTRFSYGLGSSKRSQIGSTLTWIVAFLIILFILAIFILGIMGISKLNGSKDKSATVGGSYDGLLPLGQYGDFILNKPLIISNKERTVSNLINLYLTNPDNENDLKCLFLENSRDIYLTLGYFAGLEVDGKNIAEPVASECEDSFFSSLKLFSNGKKVSIIEIKFFNCDPLPAKSGALISDIQKKALGNEILEMVKDNRLYDSACQSLEDKKAILNIHDQVYSNPGTTDDVAVTRTSEELAKIDEILLTKTDIKLGNNLWKYDSSKNLWFYGVASSDSATMKKELIGTGDYYADVSLAKLEAGIWIIPWKNIIK